MLKAFSIVAVAVLATAALPSVTFAQMKNGATADDSMSKGPMESMSSMMKRSKMMRHHSMHRGMMRKSMGAM